VCVREGLGARVVALAGAPEGLGAWVVALAGLCGAAWRGLACDGWDLRWQHQRESHGSDDDRDAAVRVRVGELHELARGEGA
jgi:hypothetical protein